MRIVVAMSGGVDSSVAAALLAEQGHDVIGLSMQLYDQRGEETFGSCCTLDDLHDARRVASAIGFPHYIVNFEQQFQETVIANFVREYAAGRTPMPCAHCNSDLKFSTLLDRARGLGATHVATGHYAQVTSDSDGRWLLRRGADPDKDQSYFLFSLTQEQLAGAVFPVGALPKRRCASRRGGSALRWRRSPTARRSASSPTATMRRSSRAASRRSPAAAPSSTSGTASSGRTAACTASRSASARGWASRRPMPLYVSEDRRRVEQRVTVGPRASLERTTLTASGSELDCGNGAPGWLRCRRRSVIVTPPRPDACARCPIGRAELDFDKPQPAMTPGQAVVFYDGDVVVGGGGSINRGSGSRIGTPATRDSAEPDPCVPGFSPAYAID